MLLIKNIAEQHLHTIRDLKNRTLLLLFNSRMARETKCKLLGDWSEAKFIYIKLA